MSRKHKCPRDGRTKYHCSDDLGACSNHLHISHVKCRCITLQHVSRMPCAIVACTSSCQGVSPNLGSSLSKTKVAVEPADVAKLDISFSDDLVTSMLSIATSLSPGRILRMSSCLLSLWICKNVFGVIFLNCGFPTGFFFFIRFTFLYSGHTKRNHTT